MPALTALGVRNLGSEASPGPCAPVSAGAFTFFPPSVFLQGHESHPLGPTLMGSSSLHPFYRTVGGQDLNMSFLGTQHVTHDQNAIQLFIPRTLSSPSYSSLGTCTCVSS